MGDEKAFGNWCRTRREALGLSRRDVAEEVGINTEYYHRIEAGARLPSKPLAYTLKVFLGEEERLSDFIYRHLTSNIDASREEISEILANEIIKAGYRIMYSPRDH